jgi:hypothetical protein
MMNGEKPEQTGATKQTERGFSFASFALLVCFVWMRRLNITAYVLAGEKQKGIQYPRGAPKTRGGARANTIGGEH